MSQWVNGSVDWSMGRMGPGSMGQWVMGLGYDGSDGSWVTNGDPWSTLPLIRLVRFNRTTFSQLRPFVPKFPEKPDHYKPGCPST